MNRVLTCTDGSSFDHSFLRNFVIFRISFYFIQHWSGNPFMNSKKAALESDDLIEFPFEVIILPSVRQNET